LQAVNYEKENIKEVVERCVNFDSQQQSKLLIVLRTLEQLFLGCCSKWKGNPVSIKAMEGVKPVWAKPYPVPLKNHQVF
jgi:hypothetical protein